MSTTLTRILRAAARKPGEPLNILWCVSTHWPQELPAPHLHFAIHGGADWPAGEPPEKLTVITKTRLCEDVPMDVVVSLDDHKSYAHARKVAYMFHLPHIASGPGNLEEGAGQGVLRVSESPDWPSVIEEAASLTITGEWT